LDIALIVHYLFEAIRWLIYARIIISLLQMFTRVDLYNPIVRFIYETTEPMMAPFRRLIPPVGGIDFSVILLWFVINLVESLVMQILGMALG